MYQFEFSGRCPSAAQLRAHIKRAVAAGHDWIQLIWGENQITIEKAGGPWFGHGWIRRTGGDDLARELSTGGRP
jgi:hypothetical protein